MAEAGAELVVWVVYERPLDFPFGYVVRPWISAAGHIRAGMSVKAKTLGEARALIPPGLVRLPRMIGEDPAIFESWI